MSKVNSDISKEMLLRLKAQFEAFYNDNEDEALELIERAIDDYPKLQYALLAKFDICDKFNRVTEMEQIIERLKEGNNNRSYANNDKDIKFDFLSFGVMKRIREYLI